MLFLLLRKDPNRYISGIEVNPGSFDCSEQGSVNLFCLRMFRLAINRESVRIFLFIINIIHRFER